MQMLKSLQQAMAKLQGDIDAIKVGKEEEKENLPGYPPIISKGVPVAKPNSPVQPPG